ncbi:2-oxoacid ferredoxin oxidoreductase [Candidatus Roizmanbacteria bacterium CG_4_10_14_0_8_um_filter_39_9]|uniref:2-oxoacid ferredoxin oxidoreductase n=1 Tax=Candidatus Roizmanbacteria bacterium CG_4_10_14_0_8_um_filter_39_9 TaxID=1974829 RepID=A0A2M7QE89_9BACT|nr:MAG: 2-oxoacid ferredoxin oxidoreductase [Candidatus Roizmanbacteria bacterium CG_4_10_14_0_8_um_filter_39_9]
MATPADFNGYTPTWCPGCGNFGIGVTLRAALAQLGFSPSSVFVSFGIGCSGNMNDFLNAYASHGLHGRALPVAIGMKLANHMMKTIVVAGDGDFYGEGGNHFMHGARGNHDITVIVHDNRVYGLTTGQAAPTARKGYKSKSTPGGIIETEIDSMSLAITQGATFVAQAFAGNTIHMVEIMKAALSHKGFSLVNVLQPCVTFNKINTYQYYVKNAYKLEDVHDKANINKALLKAQEVHAEKFPLGVIYQIEKPAFHEQLTQLEESTLVSHQNSSYILDELLADFR